MYYYLIPIFSLIGYILYKCYLYPLYLSPLSKLPGPPVSNLILGHYTSILNNKQGETFTHLIKKYGGIFRYHVLLNKPYLSISDQKLVQQILITRAYEFPKFFLNKILTKELVGESISFAQGYAHKKQRKMMNPSFSIAAVKEMVPLLVQAGHNLKDNWMKQIGNKKGERITITKLIPKITLDIIGLVGFNYEFNSTTTDSELARAYHSIVSAGGEIVSPLLIELIDYFPFIRNIPTDFAKKRCDAVKNINNISNQLIAEKKNATIRGKDFLSLLMQANEGLPADEQLTHDELVGLVMTILFAGHETTSTSLTWSLYYLAKNPDMQDRLRKEILEVFTDRNNFPTFDEIDNLKYLDCVYKEILRIMPPIPSLTRYNKKDEIMNGYVIPKGTPLMIPIYAIHHDPSIWGDDAEHFNPSRWLDPEIKSKITNCNYLPFGAGPRSCLGMRMAYSELKIILFIIIRNFEFRLVKGFTFKKITFGFTKPAPGMDLFVSKVDY
ncbi:cytochrome P450 [Gigaspora rosea]|uniref:Cytochrome P450 n=1 Tax=Gigaspora rosea TaxID=44941 RepID=A0A397UWQ0_9GLOM|nr:cytochrome P450 [Gigaspora rosea]